MPSRTPAVRSDAADLDAQIGAAQAATTVLWRGEAVPFDAVPERIAALDGRRERELLAGAYREAQDALAPLLERRLEAWRRDGTPPPDGVDPRALVTDLERFVVHSETPYYAALRRYLALIDIEQGDATEADLWHVARGTAWGHWFGAREVVRAAAATGRAPGDPGGHDGWRAAEVVLAGAGPGDGSVAADAAAGAYRSLVGAPDWLRDELGIAAAEVPSVADFVAWVRVWQLRRDIGLLHYELRLLTEPLDPALARAYYSGIVGHMVGVAVAEEGYLHAVPAPWASIGAIERSLLAAQLVETLELRHGSTWWRDADATGTIDAFAATRSRDDALALLGYDALDWRPFLRQVRTRLIGEMSGYGGPNITTRAGTRKV